MAGKAGSRKHYPLPVLNDIRYFRMKGWDKAQVAARLGMGRDTVRRLITEHDLDRELSYVEYARVDIMHHFMRTSGMLDDPEISRPERASASSTHLRQGSLLMRANKGTSQMADEVPRRKFEDMSDDELRAMLVRLGLGVETKSEPRNDPKTMHAEDCTCPFHGASAASSETAHD